MLNYSKRNPTIFFGGVGEVYIVGWVLTGYLFDCPQNSRLFLPLAPERLHRVSPPQPGPVQMVASRCPSLFPGCSRGNRPVLRQHEEFKRRIKTQTVLPSAETAAMCSGRCLPRVKSPCAKS